MRKSHNYLYTVHCFRFGRRENHSYLLGVYSSKTKARVAADREESYRGGKYECEIIQWILNQDLDLDEPTFKVLKELPDETNN